MKMIVVYQKSPRLRHIGHLDLMRAMQRALRKSGLPIAYSQGFNPHILLSFASPLSVGVPGEREIMEVPLSADISAADFLTALNRALPPELPCLSARAVEDRHPAPMALLRWAKYRIAFYEPAEAALSAIPKLLALGSMTVSRRTKSGEKPCDIRPMIAQLAAMPGENALECILALREDATCKPQLLLSALSELAGLDAAPDAAVTRAALYGEGLAPLEDL